METGRKALLTVEGEAGGKGVVVIPEELVLDGVRHLREVTDSPILISEVDVQVEGSEQ